MNEYQENYLCDEHLLLNVYYCKECIILLCSSCTVNHIHQSHSLPSKLETTYIFYKYLNAFNNLDCFLVKKIDSNRPYILYLLNRKYDEYLKFQVEDKLLTLNHQNLSNFFLKKKTKSEFYLLSEAFDRHRFRLNAQNLNYVVAKVLEVFEYLHNKIGIYHGNFSEDSLNVKNSELMISGIVFPFIPEEHTPSTIFEIQKRDYKAFIDIIGKSLDLSKNNANLNFDDNPAYYVYQNLLKCEDQDIKPDLKELRSHFPQKIATPLDLLTESKKKVSPMETTNSLSKIYFNPKPNSLKLEISDNREKLEKEISIYCLDFMHLIQKILLSREIQSFIIRINPSIILVSPEDNWRTFWWYAFYQKPHFKRKRSDESKISLRVHSQNDW